MSAWQDGPRLGFHVRMGDRIYDGFTRRQIARKFLGKWYWKRHVKPKNDSKEHSR